MTNRPSRHDLFMVMAHALALRGTCLRAQVGALIVVDRRPAGGGYNGSPSGMPTCIDEGACEMLGGAELGCQRAVHAEMNAIAWAARHGIRTQGATMYATHSPCKACAQLIVAAQFKEFIYEHSYRAERLDILVGSGVEILRYHSKLEVTYK